MTGSEGGILSPGEFDGAFCHYLQLGQDFTPASGSRKMLHKISFVRLTLAVKLK